MNFKKFSTSDNQWHDIPYYQHKTATDTLTLPAVIYPNASSITVGIKGNTTQSGTPAPSNPVDVNGTGERTAQLIPEIVQGGVSTSNGSFSNSSNRVRTNYIPVESGKTYAVSSGNLYLATGCYYNNGVFSSKIDEVVGITTSATFTVPENVNQIAIGFRTATGTTDITPSDLQNYMLNEGSTALPYEPYGYKIPILSASTTTPVYLGEVQTTRKIKKIVASELTWTDGTVEGVNFYRASLPVSKKAGGGITTLLSNKYRSVSIRNNLIDGSIAAYNTTTTEVITIRDDRYSSASEWIAVNGDTDIWYVLETEETGIVNEPLMRIGDYADTVSGITIPCTAGENTLDVQTTVQPSEVTAGFSGWHPVQSVHESENGQWD